MPNNNQYYAYVIKQAGGGSFKTVSTSSYSISQYGERETTNYPYTSSIDVRYFEAGTDLIQKKFIYALQTHLDANKIKSPHYAFSSSYGEKDKQKLTLVSIPSIFYGSSIQKGSVELSFSITGTLVAKLQDTKLNGELIETTGSNTGSVAGVVLYNEGFILLTGSWNLVGGVTDTYIYNPSKATDSAKWVYWGAGTALTGSANETYSSSFDLNFNGTNYVPTLTMMAHAKKSELNHSNNPTYIKYNEAVKKTVNSSSVGYFEPIDWEIKNITKYPYENYSGSLEKQTYITKIGIFDEKRNLIAIAKLSKPLRKTENRDYTFKLKLDI